MSGGKLRPKKKKMCVRGKPGGRIRSKQRRGGERRT